MAGVVIFSTSYQSQSLAEREKVRLGEEALQQFLTSALELSGVRGIVPLETCNRVEYVVSAATDEALAEFETLLRKVHSGAPFSRFLKADGLRHLFRVVSGLDSMVIGEVQIAGQVKDAYYAALAKQWTDRELNRLFHRAFFVSKRVRSSTKIGWGSVSVASLGVRLAEQIVGSLNGAKVLLLGAGEMGQLSLRHLLTAGARDVQIFNRTYEKAWELARRFSVTARPLSELPQAVDEADVIVSAVTTESGYAMPKELFVGRISRSGKCLLDLSFPRSIDPAVSDLDGVYLYGIDDLRDLSELNRREREESRSEAELVVEEEVSRYLDEEVHEELGELSHWVDAEVAREERRIRRELLKGGELDGEVLRRVFAVLQPSMRSLASRLLHAKRSELREKGLGRNAPGQNSSSSKERGGGRV